MSPSTCPATIECKECCFCIGAQIPAKNRSPSSASRAISEIAVSSVKSGRETSQTVCCYKSVSLRSRLTKRVPQSSCTGFIHRPFLRDKKRTTRKCENISEVALNDKIKSFENPLNNIINRPTTTKIRNEEANVNVDPVKSVSESQSKKVSGVFSRDHNKNIVRDPKKLRGSSIDRQLPYNSEPKHYHFKRDISKVAKIVLPKFNPPSNDPCDNDIVNSSLRSAFITEVNERKNWSPCVRKTAFSVKNSANQNICLLDQSFNHLVHNIESNIHESNKYEDCEHQKLVISRPGLMPRSNADSENSSSMDKSSLNMEKLKKFGFGRKSSSSASLEIKPQGSKTERLRELTEKLKGHKTGSFKVNNSPPIPPPLPSAPIPPPRKAKRNSYDVSGASSFDNLSCPIPTTVSPLNHIGKSKSVEPSSLFTRQLKSIQERFLRPNISASNLESMNSNSLKEDEFFSKLSRPESRIIIGSYAQKSIPFRSASFSQSDTNTGKYNKPDIASLKASINQKLLSSSSDIMPKENCSSEQCLEEMNDPLKRSSDIATITEETVAENLAESIESKLAQINVVQANEMTLKDTFIEETHAEGSKIQFNELQQATTCLIPIPVFECVEKEWSPLPEHGGEEFEFFCHPIPEDLPQAKVIENLVLVNSAKITDAGVNDKIHCDRPEIELNNIALQLDEILKETNPKEEINNAVKTQIPQSKEGLLKQTSIDSAAEDIRISPEIQEVLETVAETLNANINIVSLLCPDQDLSSSSERGGENNFALLKTVDSSDLGSFDKSDNEFPETVRKRNSNDVNSGSEKSSPNVSPNVTYDTDKRKLDKSRRRKGIYIQWPAIKRSQEIDSFDSSNNEDAPIQMTEEKKSRKHLSMSSSFSEPVMPRQSESLCSLEPNTPDSDCSPNKPLVWPTSVRRQSLLTYQSSDERDEFTQTYSPSKTYRIVRSDSVSDNESDRNVSSTNESELKRYSKRSIRPLRGPYGQMLEAEMKKQEELSRNNSVKKSNCSIDSTSGFSKQRKSGGSLPVSIHQRTASSPVPIIHFDSTAADLPINHKRYPSSVDYQKSERSDRVNLNHETKKLSLDLSPKRTSSDTSDKHSKKVYASDKPSSKRSLDEIRIPKKIILGDKSETPKIATPELLSRLLKGSSEKLLNDQQFNNGISLPKAVLNSLGSTCSLRTHVVVEIFNTEVSYVESLQTIVMKYLNPLKLPESSGLVDIQTVEEIFFMVPSILHIHEKFLEELRKRLDAWDPLQRIGDAYHEVFSKPLVLETYSAFVNNWNKAKDAIRMTKQTKPAFSKFLEAMAREHKGKLSLDNLLIKIIQKFPNYELMFQRLIKHTDAEHPDYFGCSDSLKLVHDILLHLNCKEREALENDQREANLRDLENVIEGISDLVSNDRNIISFELVSMPSGQAGRKERGLFLFNDLLVITSIKKRSGTIRKPNSNGSFLDTNKYKFLAKISLDDLEIVKSKDENVRRIIKEIEHLNEDNTKILQMLEIASGLRSPHSSVEESIRDLQTYVQRQLTERQTSDTSLNTLELNVNASSGPQSMTVVFSKPEKRSQWEEMFTEAKQKLQASIERLQTPEFIAALPIRKTRAGLQFTCAAPTLGTQKDVWVCNSDGYVGQVCVLSLDGAEPTVTSCNGVCNARILCLTSVPGYSELSDETNLNSSIIDDDRVSVLNTSTSSKKIISNSNNQSNVQLDLSSSSDSEPDAPVELTPSTCSTVSQVPSDENESQMWLGTEDGFIHVYNCSDNIRIKKNKIKIQGKHASAVSSILYLDNRIFVSLANGDICVYIRENSTWNTQSHSVTVGSISSPVTKLLNVRGKLWCSIQGVIKILNTVTLQVEDNVEISNETKPISNMVLLNNFVWISTQNSATILCCSVINLKTVCEVNLAPAVNKMLSSSDNIIQQHKSACLRVTSLLACKDIIWVGTSAGVLLEIKENFGKSAPIVTGISQGHTGHVRFLTSVVIEDLSSKRHWRSEPTNSDAPNSKHVLIISGGDGFEDFRNTNTLNDVAGREDSTNHLLMWQQTL